MMSETTAGTAVAADVGAENPSSAPEDGGGVTPISSDDEHVDFAEERRKILERSANALSNILDVMSNIYEQSGRSRVNKDGRNVEVQEMEAIWRRSFPAPY